MPTIATRTWLFWFALLTTACTFVLIVSGGLVTSKGVGLSVPDWPNSYGYNMFLFPISQWVGGIFYEHVHRLVASAVGVLTTVIALRLWPKVLARLFLTVGLSSGGLYLFGGHNLLAAMVGGFCLLLFAIGEFVFGEAEPRRWLRWLGLTALVVVVLQGVLGGLRVTALKDEIGIFHACLAQGFFALLALITLALSRSWELLHAARSAALSSRVAWIAIGVTAVIYLQLGIGATMRHQHAELSIPDFPLAYGKVIPSLDPDSIQRINRERVDQWKLHSTSRFLIELQLLHRFTALAILCGVIGAAWPVVRREGAPAFIKRAAWLWVGLIGTQVMLGAVTIWSNKAADIATAHVAVGALSLITGVLVSASILRAVGRLPVSNSIPIWQARQTEVPV